MLYLDDDLFGEDPPKSVDEPRPHTDSEPPTLEPEVKTTPTLEPEPDTTPTIEPVQSKPAEDDLFGADDDEGEEPKSKTVTEVTMLMGVV